MIKIFNLVYFLIFVHSLFLSLTEAYGEPTLSSFMIFIFFYLIHNDLSSFNEIILFFFTS